MRAERSSNVVRSSHPDRYCRLKYSAFLFYISKFIKKLCIHCRICSCKCIYIVSYTTQNSNWNETEHEENNSVGIKGSFTGV